MAGLLRGLLRRCVGFQFSDIIIPSKQVSKKVKKNMALFESYDRRIDNINAVLKEYGINSIEEAKEI